MSEGDKVWKFEYISNHIEAIEFLQSINLLQYSMLLRATYDGKNAEQIIQFSHGHVLRKEDGTLVLHDQDNIPIEVGDIILGPGSFGSGTKNWGVKKLEQ